jgi:hypothetical protein
MKLKPGFLKRIRAMDKEIEQRTVWKEGADIYNIDSVEGMYINKKAKDALRGLAATLTIRFGMFPMIDWDGNNDE